MIYNYVRACMVFNIIFIIFRLFSVLMVLPIRELEIWMVNNTQITNLFS